MWPPQSGTFLLHLQNDVGILEDMPGENRHDVIVRPQFASLSQAPDSGQRSCGGRLASNSISANLSLCFENLFVGDIEYKALREVQRAERLSP
jgi:hypothetical protein